MSGGPTWYDTLGVAPDASAEEIKRAWRAATDKFEPGTGAGQFRMFNDAADVLLDPERRAAYDASLAGDDTAAAPATLAAAPAATGATAPVAEDVPPPPGPEGSATPSRRERRALARAERGPAEPARRGQVAVVVLLVLLLAGTVAGAGYYAVQDRRDAATAEARDQAPAAAERAAVAMLSYDYRQLPADRERAVGFLTPGYAREYEKTFALLEENPDGTPGAALQTKTVVKATVMGTAVVDAQSDVARVLVFVNQTSEKEGVDPQVFQNRVAMTLRKDGNRWLVSDLKSY